ncbi:MAG: DUF4168 domain-containing protein [Synechococcaceae cyanobacterium SM2_3_2]|nr:DUF4168 domain-containing protein [Synechococcaceae cyanobacterium SM2_3_2]
MAACSNGWRRWTGISLLVGLSWIPGQVILGEWLAEVAIAQTAESAFTAEKLALFAKIVLEIEPHRLEAQELSAEAESENREEIRRDFIRQATEIITAVGLTVPDYNRITLAIRSEDGQALRDQIEAEIRTLQASGYEPGQL